MAKMNRGGQPPAFMSTHPSHERRIADLESLLDEAMPFYERAPEKSPDRRLPIGDQRAIGNRRPQPASDDSP
jgi:predicted Zn-dependent protease